MGGSVSDSESQKDHYGLFSIMIQLALPIYCKYKMSHNQAMYK